DAARRSGGVLNLGDAQAGMFIVQPDGVIAALHAQNLDDFGITELSGRENPRELVLCQKFLEAPTHAAVLLPRGIVSRPIMHGPAGKGKDFKQKADDTDQKP